jgi:AraC-like DNA-binding protein
MRTFEFKPLPVEIEVKDLSFAKEFPKLLGRPHKAIFYQIIWITRGKAMFRIDFREIVVSAGELLIISSGQVCEFDTKSDYSGRIILFTSTFLMMTELDSGFLHTAEILNPFSLNKTVPVCPQLTENLIALLAEELKRPTDSFQTGIAQSYLRVILFEAERQIGASYPPVKNTIGRRFYDAVEQHFRESRSVGFYAGLLGISENTLYRTMKRLAGNTPKGYIDSRLLLEAKRLLSYSGFSVKEISLVLGFDEPTNFSKYFHKHAGIPPTQFRDSLKKENRQRTLTFI